MEWINEERDVRECIVTEVERTQPIESIDSNERKGQKNILRKEWKRQNDRKGKNKSERRNDVRNKWKTS